MHYHGTTCNCCGPTHDVSWRARVHSSMHRECVHRYATIDWATPYNRLHQKLSDCIKRCSMNRIESLSPCTPGENITWLLNAACQTKHHVIHGQIDQLGAALKSHFDWYTCSDIKWMRTLTCYAGSFNVARTKLDRLNYLRHTQLGFTCPANQNWMFPSSGM